MPLSPSHPFDASTPFRSSSSARQTTAIVPPSLCVSLRPQSARPTSLQHEQQASANCENGEAAEQSRQKNRKQRESDSEAVHEAASVAPGTCILGAEPATTPASGMGLHRDSALHICSLSQDVGFCIMAFLTLFCGFQRSDGGDVCNAMFVSFVGSPFVCS